MKTVLKEFKTVEKSWLLLLLFCARPSLPQTDVECECLESTSAKVVSFRLCIFIIIIVHCVDSCTV